MVIIIEKIERNIDHTLLQMTTRKNLEILLYKNQLDKKYLIELLPKLSSKCVQLLLQDLSNVFTQEDNTINVFTDGGCKRNGKENSKGAYAVYFTDDKDSPFYNLNVSCTFDNPTNQKAELLAIEKAYQIILKNSQLFENYNITIITDSMYSINCICKWPDAWLKNNWKTRNNQNVKNADIIKRILQLKNNIPKVKLQHTFSHTEKPRNENNHEYTIWHGNYQVDKMVNDVLLSN